MQRNVTHTATPTWVLGTRVLITWPATRDRPEPVTAEGTVAAQQRVAGTGANGRAIKQRDEGPFHTPFVEFTSPWTGKPEARYFPDDWLTVLDADREDQPA